MTVRHHQFPNRFAGALASCLLLGALLLAASAAHAGTSVDYAANIGSPTDTFLSKAGLKLRGRCLINTAVDVRVIRNRSKRRAATFGANAQTDITESGSSHQSYFGVKKLYSKTDDFQLLTGSGLNAFDSSVGQLIQAERRRVMTIDWFAEAEGDALGKDCVFGGTKRVAKKGSPKAILYRANKGSGPRVIFDDLFQLRAECVSNGGDPDLNLYVKAGPVTSSTYVASQSDVNNDGNGEAAYSQAEAISDQKVQLDVSGVADDRATGQIVVNTSNPQYAIDWIASSSGALGKDCLFAGTVRTAGALDANRITYSANGGEALETFFDHGGVTLGGSCSATPDLFMNVGSAISGSAAHWGMQSDANGDGTDSYAYDEADDLASADVPVLGATEDENAIGELVFGAPGGDYTSLEFIADEGGIFGHAACAAAGISEVAHSP
jgi:hypothetical protein